MDASVDDCIECSVAAMRTRLKRRSQKYLFDTCRKPYNDQSGATLQASFAILHRCEPLLLHAPRGAALCLPKSITMPSLLFYLLLLHSFRYSWSFAVHVDGYDKAFRTIDECAIKGQANDELYDAVRFVEVYAYKIYPDLEEKQKLWEMAHGSWKLQLSTGGAKNKSFHPPPAFLPFSFAMITDRHFGNGVGKNENTIWLALLHNQYWNGRLRRMVVTPADVYLFGRKVNLPDLIAKGMKLGKSPDDFEASPPTFVLVGASEHALIARGNQSGGLAIWTRLPDDLRKVAFKDGIVD